MMLSIVLNFIKSQQPYTPIYNILNLANIKYIYHDSNDVEVFCIKFEYAYCHNGIDTYVINCHYYDYELADGVEKDYSATLEQMNLVLTHLFFNNLILSI